MRDAVWPVMVLAHNEANKIVACLDSIYRADADRKFNIFVMANGCTDNTESIVREYSKTHDGVNLVSLKMADKCNAWNVFIHETVPTHTPNSDVYFFMDGDCRACPRAFSELAKGLFENPEARAAGAMPMAGRNKVSDTRDMMERRALVANLYALTKDFVHNLQAKRVRLPLGLEGDDGLIGAFAKWDLHPTMEWNDNRIVPCAKAGFTFDPVSPIDFFVWKTYLRRLLRYGRRRYEFQLLGPKLRKDGLRALPEHITDIYADANSLRLNWQGIYTITNLIALKRMKRGKIQ
jgi:glycosyltransferase involved in cell wall biosynthesis